MANLQEQFRPYAAPANVIAVLNRIRTRNLPETINSDLLRVAGVPENSLYRVMQALQFLNLIHEDGDPTDTMIALAGSTDAQYRELLGKVVREAYRSEFSVIDPSQDPQPRIIDAFRPYQPRSQTSRMVMLFQGLCREAGMPVFDAPRERRMREPQPRRPKTSGERHSIVVPTRRSTTQDNRHINSGQNMSEILFGITEADVTILDEKEFNEVWSALGKVARARARAKRKATEEKATTETREEDEEEKE